MFRIPLEPTKLAMAPVADGNLSEAVIQNKVDHAGGD
jgi:hypothetical protein